MSLARRSRILALVGITWGPMCIFALLQGVAFGPTPRASFLLDFATYARFFVGLPILLVAESIIRPRLDVAERRFVEDGFVKPEDRDAFEAAALRLDRRRASALAALVIGAVALLGAWRLTFEARAVGAHGWQTIGLGEGHALPYSLAALWNHLVAAPVVLFLTYRWLWRVLVWAIFLADVARLNLSLVPTHADGAGGLAFLDEAHRPFAVLAFAVGSVVSAEGAFRILYDGAGLRIFEAPVLIMLTVVLALFLGPLLVFCPALARSRWSAVVAYGSLVVRHNRGFDEKWIGGPSRDSEPLLGAPDISSLADLGSSFRVVSTMRVAPFSRWTVLILALATVLPALPFLLLVVPMHDVVEVLARVVA